MRRKIVAGNWKMNGSADLVADLVPTVRKAVAGLDNGVEVVIVPPALYVPQVRAEADPVVAVGVQNLSGYEAGAYTGEISAAMAVDSGCRYALIGHSERRRLFAESDQIAAEKVMRALESGLSAILCVGETLEERDQGRAEQVVEGQVCAGLSGVGPDQWDRVVVAYEPVWAIGTGKTATTDDAQAMHASIRRWLGEMGAPAQDVPLLYGGSVKADNAAALFAEPDVDGGLIGGASLMADEFLSICRAMPVNAGN
ncbi:triose-phosphate isomerase [Marinobacter sp.]|uniref:triose-phosphate isomerase n=1 Tax=Marinobacter sp. TaxID=50741 RepID=UPI001986CA66|nr:triose-phosphate isomerase [Marinobacter sp.]MBC7193365.1 triose-phosphate isomerase [Marinobacter sp.]